MCIVKDQLEEHEEACQYRVQVCRNVVWGCSEELRQMDEEEHEQECEYCPQVCH